MPQYYPTQGQANAELYAAMIQQLGRDIGEGFSEATRIAYLRKKLSLESIDKLKTFMSLPADKRKALLADPNFRMDIMKTLDPDTFSSGKKAKKALKDEQGMEQRNKTALALGEPTVEEVAARTKATQEANKAAAEAGLAQQKLRLSTGVEAPTPMSLLIAGDVKDPIAAALFSLIPPEQLKNIALADKKQGPIYQQVQMQDWFKWGIQEGLPAGVAMQVAGAVSTGQWDKVPMSYTDYKTGKQIPVRGKAEQELANQAIQANARMQEVQNTIANSIATATMGWMEKTGMTEQQARQNVMAMRAGKPIPFESPVFAEMAGMQLILKQQEIQKNANTILDDKYGISTINEALKAMVAQYKDAAGWTGTGAQAKDLADKIAKTREDLTARLAARYGIKYDNYEDIHWFSTSVAKAMGTVAKTAKTTGIFYGIDLASDAGKAFYNSIDDEIKKSFTDTLGTLGEGLKAPFTVPVQKGNLTPEQESMLKNIYANSTKALNDESVPPAQKKMIKDYIEKVLEPAYSDPSKFMNIFSYNFQPPQE